MNKKENHHVIPLSLWGSDNDNNKIYIDSNLHSNLHRTQNIWNSKLREYKKLTNHILVPNNKSLDIKKDLLFEFFSDIMYFEQEQFSSLAMQIIEMKNITHKNRPVSNEILSLVNEYIEQQKDLVKWIIQWNIRM